MKKTLLALAIASISCLAVAGPPQEPGRGQSNPVSTARSDALAFAIAEGAEINNNNNIKTGDPLSVAHSDAKGGTGGSVNVQRSAPAVVGGPAPGGWKSCRLGASGGGSGEGGGFILTLFLGNDQTCLSGTTIDLMDQMNARYPDTFKHADYMLQACKIEGMDGTEACKADKALRGGN